MSKVYQEERFLYLFAILSSLLLSFWIGYRETVINPDAICYLLSAEEIGKSGLHAAMNLCGQARWPFYSILIYSFTKLSHFSYYLSAYLLDGVFSACSVVLFILIVKELGGSLRTLWLTAFVILLSHQFNGIRVYIIRDHGFWAAYLGSVFFLLRYFRQPSWKTALAWNLSLLIATLFRIEGAVFLLAMPFVSFLTRYPLKERAKCFFMLNVPTIFISLGIGMWLLLHPQQTIHQFGRIAELIQQLQHGFMIMQERYQAARAALAQHVLANDSIKEAGLIAFLVFLAWYVISVINNLSFAYALILFYAWWRRTVQFARPAMLVLGGYIAVNILISAGFLLEHFFLSKRYLIALTLVLMLWIPFALEDLVKHKARVQHRFMLFAVFLFIFISSLGGIFDFGYSKAYIHGAGDWLAEHVPANATLYANDYQLMYYSQHFTSDELFKNLREYVHLNAIANGQWKQFDYLALRLDKQKEANSSALQEIQQLKPLQIFANKRGDSVVIYKVTAKSGE